MKKRPNQGASIKWRIVLHPGFVKEFNSMDRSSQETALKAFLQLLKNPLQGKNIEKFVNGKWEKTETKK
jgi:hypothetical protein